MTDLSKLRIERQDPVAVPRRRWRRVITWTAILVGLCLIGLVVYQRTLGAAVEVEQTAVSVAYPYQAYTVLNATGYVVAQRKASVASKATGRLEWLGVAEGSQVRAGQVIARLESLDMAAARDQTAASVTVSQANLAQVQAELDEAQRALRRSEELLAQNFVSSAAHDIAIGRYDRARAAVNSAAAAIKVAQANWRAADVNVEQTVIRAPFDGVVLTKNANVGDTITPFSSALDTKGAVVTIADMSTLEVEADVSESNLQKVRVGQPCEIELDAVPDTRFEGYVNRVVPTVDRTKATVMTKITFRQIDPRILPDMSAKVAFLSQPVDASQRSARTAVSAAAVVPRGGREVIFVVRDGKAIETPVTSGEKIGDLIEIRQGAKPGDKVVLRPPQQLHDGAPVHSAKK